MNEHCVGGNGTFELLTVEDLLVRVEASGSQAAGFLRQTSETTLIGISLEGHPKSFISRMTV
jgi:hypothetical protein